MFVEGEPILALCYINQEGDNANMCFLSKEHLYVKYRNRINAFEHKSIVEIAFEKKILLFPLIVGGIMAPLSIHALLNSYFNPWLLLSLMITGLTLFYFGWQGSPSMTIRTAIKDYHFFIKHPTPNLKAFAKYAQYYISNDEKYRRFYFVQPISEWQEIKKKEYIKVTQPISVLSWDEIPPTLFSEEVLLALDPIESNVQLSFIKTENSDQLQGVIKQDIPVADIIEVKGHY